jgi:hypothetical protein
MNPIKSITLSMNNEWDKFLRQELIIMSYKLLARLWRLAASVIHLKTISHLLRSHTRRTEGFLALLLDAHLLLQGDFFLTSRSILPKWNESGNWERYNLMRKLRLLEKIGIARKSEKRKKLRNFL